MDTRERLRAAGEEYQAVRVSYATAREHLQPAVVDALRNGVPQHEVVKLSGLTREYVRRLARKAGIGPER
jgi:hypothetical protein